METANITLNCGGKIDRYGRSKRSEAGLTTPVRYCVTRLFDGGIVFSSLDNPPVAVIVFVKQKSGASAAFLFCARGGAFAFSFSCFFFSRLLRVFTLFAFCSECFEDALGSFVALPRIRVSGRSGFYVDGLGIFGLRTAAEMDFTVFIDPLIHLADCSIGAEQEDHH